MKTTELIKQLQEAVSKNPEAEILLIQNNGAEDFITDITFTITDKGNIAIHEGYDLDWDEEDERFDEYEASF